MIEKKQDFYGVIADAILTFLIPLQISVTQCQLLPSKDD